MKNIKHKNFVIAIVGPTTVGKSAFGVELAKRLNGEIISADSRQVYKGLDIGTGKITKKEMKGVKHHLLDVCDINKNFTVVEFVELSEKAIQEIFSFGKIPIVVGGTGLYIDTLLSGMSIPEVKENKILRKSLSLKTTEELFLMLQKLDSNRSGTIDKNNRVRLIRAIEIAEVLGSVPKVSFKKKPYNILWLGLKKEQSILKNDIKERLIKRIDEGLIGEVEKILASGVSKNRLISLGLEYRETVYLLEGKYAKEEYIETLSTRISQYAKRQMTWFKRNKDIIWIDII